MTRHCGVTAITGHCGGIFVNEDAVARITRWSFDISTAGVRYFSTDARAWSRFIPSVNTGTGKAEFIYETENTLAADQILVNNPQDTVIAPGYYVTMTLLIDRSEPRGFYIPQAVISAFSMSVDIQTAEVVGGSFAFEVDGIVNLNGQEVDPVMPPGFGEYTSYFAAGPERG